MELLGAIVREPQPPGILYEEWLAVIGANESLVPMEPVPGINPFTRQPMDYRRSYGAWVVVDGRQVGSIVWDADCLQVSGSADVVSSVAHEVARRLEARFWTMADLMRRPAN